MRGGIEAVILDYGGVLARTVDPEPRAAWERDLGLTPGTLTATVHDKRLWVAAQNGSMQPDAHWQAVGESSGAERIAITRAAGVVLRRGRSQSTTVGPHRPTAATGHGVGTAEQLQHRPTRHA